MPPGAREHAVEGQRLVVVEGTVMPTLFANSRAGARFANPAVAIIRPCMCGMGTVAQVMGRELPRGCRPRVIRRRPAGCRQKVLLEGWAALWPGLLGVVFTTIVLAEVLISRRADVAPAVGGHGARRRPRLVPEPAPRWGPCSPFEVVATR